MRAAFVIIPCFTLAVCLAVAASEIDRGGKLRLTRSEIDNMTKEGAGAGTSGVAGIRTTILMGDPSKEGPYTIEIRVPAHTRIQAHTHRDSRTAVVVSGKWYFGYGDNVSDALVKELGPGSFYTEPASTSHFAITRDQPASVYITGMGPTNTIYNHDERSSQ